MSHHHHSRPPGHVDRLAGIVGALAVGVVLAVALLTWFTR